ncbi:MAG: saccharopine dehydrogenase C-terminal domain-containing protein [Flavobacteriaceae bacterium]|nr:saccharopine dehydrogenase C-terminal domain-containing protein [Flavobacteriaceae bacterium]
MRKILIIGSGKSSSYLIKYLLSKSEKENLFIIIADKYIAKTKALLNNHSNSKALKLDVFDNVSRAKEILAADIVISMLPARFHLMVAKDCIKHSKNMLTASYISDEMLALNNKAIEKDIVIMNEIGLDPGIDHMSAMKVIDHIKEKNAKITLFESYTGGLIAPESDNNLWNYKFTWNPRNVVLAGQGGPAKFVQQGYKKYIPYNKLFKRTQKLEVKNYGSFEGYANRDSLKYREIYGLEEIKTLCRGTIRKVGFSESWDVFVQLGMTDDSYTIENSMDMTFRDFVDLFLPYSAKDKVELKLQKLLNISESEPIWSKLLEIDLFSSQKTVTIDKATPAQILEFILCKSWSLDPNDKDMIVMTHKFIYELNNKKYQIDSNMVCIGEDQTYTAMAKTVGLPLAIATLAILNSKITVKGVQLPVNKAIYNPILKELIDYGIEFNEYEIPFQTQN